MAISRVSDLPELEYSYEIDDSQQDSRFEASKLEVSYPTGDSTGTYQSKSVSVKTLQQYISNNIKENDVFYNKITCYEGADLSGRVGINDNVQLEGISPDYGLYVRGSTNSIEADQSNVIVSNGSATISAKTVQIEADQSVEVGSSNGDVSLLAEGAVRADGQTVVIASGLSTILASGSQDNLQIAAGTDIIQAHMPLYAPTPYAFDGKSKQVVNMEFLSSFAAELSAQLKQKIIEELTQESGDPTDPDDPSNPAGETITTFGTGYKLFELKTFDYELVDDPEQSYEKRHLWMLGSTIQNASTTVPAMYKILNAAFEDGPYTYEYTTADGQYSIDYYLDEFGHKVIETVDPAIKTAMIDQGTFWFYQLNGDTLTLPTNNMYFRSGSYNQSGSQLSAGEYCLPGFPGLSADVLVRKANRQDYHYYKDTIQAFTSGKLVFNNTEKYIYDGESGLVAPPSIQTYTYMVCY